MVSKIFSVAAYAGMALAATYSNNTISAVSRNATSTPTGAVTSKTGPVTVSSSLPGGITTGGGSSLTNSSALANEKAFCKVFSGTGRGYLLGDEIFKIDCGFERSGLILEIDITIALKKRATTIEDLPDCIDACVAFNEDAENDGTATRCLATSLNRDTFQCTYYSTVGAEIQPAPANIDYAQVISLDAAGNTGSSASTSGYAGTDIPLVTSVVPASTHTYTIYSCAATVTDCPYRQVATSVVDAYTTVCPGNAATTGLASAVGSGSTSAAVVTVYSASTSTLSNGATTTSYVAVNTQVINIASATATYATNSVVLTTTVSALASSGAANVASNGATATTSGVLAYTGAAQHVEAGMGMAALIGAAALLI